MTSHDGLEAAIDADTVYQSARAEAAKIQGLQRDLQLAIQDLNQRKQLRQNELSDAASAISRIDRQLDSVLAPIREQTQSSLDDLVQRRLDLQSKRTDRDEAARLQALKDQLTGELPRIDKKQVWAPIDPAAVLKLCRTIEQVLKEWSWADDVRVEFDDKLFDLTAALKRDQLRVVF